MVQILVTGSNGQLGNELRKLSRNFSSGNFHFTDVDTLDITNADALHNFFLGNKIDYIINCAAYTAVDKAESDRGMAALINCDAVRNLAREALPAKAKLIHISTDYVFDGTACKPYSEEWPVNPQSVYGSTKYEGEKEALAYSDTIVIRTSWLYSTFGNNFVKTMLRLSAERSEIKVVFDQVGTPTFAEDLADAILTIINFTEREGMRPGVYHFSNEGVCSWYDLAWEIVQFSRQECNVIPIGSNDYPTAAKRPFFSVLDKQKIKTTFNLKIPYWKTSLYNCLSGLNN